MGNTRFKTVAEAQRASKRLAASVYRALIAGSAKGLAAVPGQAGLRTDDRGPKRPCPPGTRMS
jgi:hypothetical protein